jgi:hypothetical protein
MPGIGVGGEEREKVPAVQAVVVLPSGDAYAAGIASSVSADTGAAEDPGPRAAARAVVILDEGVLRRPVGGPEVMRGQLVHLAGMARTPHIVVQVVPLAAGAHQGLDGGAFAIADFDDAATIAYQDTAVSGQIIEDASEADALAHTWDTVRLEALPRAASLSLIEETARQWT